MLKFISFIAIVGRVFCQNKVDYSKNGDDWTCKGDYQSPIALSTDFDTVKYEEDNFCKMYEDLVSIAGTTTEYKTSWNSDDFTLEVEMPSSLAAKGVSTWQVNHFTSDYSKLKGMMKAQKINFHAKSEHTIDGSRYALEMQIHHQNDDGDLGVIAILFDPSAHDQTITDQEAEVVNKFFDSLKIDELSLDTIETPVLKSPKALASVELGGLMNMAQTNNRFVYTGSITIPPCTENVYWNVINRVYPIQKSHLSMINYLITQQKRLEDGNRMTLEGNYRNIQKIEKQNPKLMVVTPPEDDPAAYKKINHVLIIVLIVVCVKLLIVSGLIILVLNSQKESIEKLKEQKYGGAKKVNQYDDDMEFGMKSDRTSARQQNTATKLVANGKMSSGNFDSEVEDSARGINYQSRVDNNMNQGLRGDASPHKVMKESKYKFYRGYKGPEDLVNFNDFFDKGTTSACKVCLTKEIWDEYKNQSCKEGVSFKLCVFSGIANQDSGIGVYAGSHDAYYKFNKLFDQVVQNYHDHSPSDKHISDMSAEGLENAEFTEEQLAMVNSTRIRVGRNLADFPLGPGVTKAQRLDIMNKVVKACDTFEGDLKGKFYPLEGMSQADQNQLIEDHFLFKEGDRFLESSGLNRDWPSGRGIFHNDDKTFLVWVNEEDQLRIISMQPGADIKAVFERLCRAAHHIETVVKFARDDHLGYITSCPTNLGTAMRASVHIKLPKLMADKATFNQVADQYEVQIRGIHGEHTETNDGVFDISNKRRLGKSEKQLVQDMINGVKALMAKEQSL